MVNNGDVWRSPETLKLLGLTTSVELIACFPVAADGRSVGRGVLFGGDLERLVKERPEAVEVARECRDRGLDAMSGASSKASCGSGQRLGCGYLLGEFTYPLAV